jgi:hypothetical protein
LVTWVLCPSSWVEVKEKKISTVVGSALECSIS